MLSNLWPLFKKARIVIFSVSAVLSLAWTIFLSVFLVREWSGYNLPERGIFIGLVAVNGVASILLYLMVVSQFKLWLDAARIAFLLLFQLGSTTIFTLFSSNFTCKNFGSEDMCKHVVSIIIIGCWVLSGILLGYAVCLAIMSCIPRPPPPSNPESALTAQTDSRSDLSGHSSRSSVDSHTWLLPSDSQKRQSLASIYSQASFIDLYTSPSATPIPTQPPRTFIRREQMPLTNYNAGYRPDTPGSTYSTSTSSTMSSLRPVQALYHVHDGENRALTPGLQSPVKSIRQLPPRPLPNPFADPVSRTPSAMSVSSVGSSVSERHGYGYGEGKQLGHLHERDLSLTFSVQSPSPPPPYTGVLPSQRLAYPRSMVNPFLDLTDDKAGCLTAPNSPYSMRSPVAKNIPSREQAATPGAHSIHSVAASLHMPDRSWNASAPPLPLPTSREFPAQPQTAMLPPGISQFDLRGQRGVSELRRYGSVPNGMTPNYNNYRVNEDVRYLPRIQVVSPPPGWVDARVDHAVDFKQWRQDVLDAAA